MTTYILEYQGIKSKMYSKDSLELAMAQFKIDLVQNYSKYRNSNIEIKDEDITLDCMIGTGWGN